MDPAGLSAAGFYKLEEVDERLAREDEQMGVAARDQNDLSGSEEEEVESPVKKPAAIKRFCLSQPRDYCLKIRNKQAGLRKLQMNSGMKPLLLGFVSLDGSKILEDFPGFSGWKARVDVLHDLVISWFISLRTEGRHTVGRHP